MVKYPIQKIENNEILKYFLQKPSFLSAKDEKKLLDFIKSNKLEEFYDLASNLIKNTREVANLYIYLIQKMESQDLPNEKIKNHVCWRLFNISSVGWLGVRDPEIINYCKNNTTDRTLTKEIKNIKIINWYDDYLKFINLENKISQGFEHTEEKVEKYYKFINKLLKDKRIKKEKFDKLIGHLQKEVSIYKGEQIIGSLISKKLQEKLAFNIIVPKLTINKSISHILLGHEE